MSDLKEALKGVLEKRGILSEVQAKLRSEVYKSLDDQEAPKPQICRENLLINELIGEYLVYNQYKYTHSVLLAESGQPKEALDRSFLSRELNLKEDGDSVMLACFLQEKSELHHAATKPHSHHPTTEEARGEKSTRTNATCTFEEPTYHNTS